MTIASMKRWINGLNLFDNERCRHDPLCRRIAIISTRLYLLILTTSIATIIVYTALGSQTAMISIDNPSYRVYLELYKQYGSTLTCPCRSVTIPYGAFISVSYQHHPVCSSFFVSDIWLRSLFNVNMSYYFPVDFRSSAFGQFQLLTSFCTLLKRFVDDALAGFFSNALHTAEIYSMPTLLAQGVSQSSFIYNSIIDEVQRIFNMIRRTTHSNRLQSAMQTTKLNSLYLNTDGSVLSAAQGGVWLNSSGNICVCDSITTCSSVSGFLNLFAYESRGNYAPPQPYIATVTGFVSGCYPLESLLQSTFECFFDRSCWVNVVRFIATTNQTSIDLLSTNATRFPPETTVNTLLNELFLEYWVTNISFEDYFKGCAPISCLYTLEQKNSLFFIVATLLGLYGGLTVALRLTIPFTIDWCLRRLEGQGTIDSERSPIEKLRTLLTELNIFKTARTLTDEFEKRTAIIATRIFLFCLILSTIIIAVYKISITRTHMVTIEQASQAIYERLSFTYLDTLECQCMNIVVAYGSFLSISPSYHPVCSSLVISDVWMSAIANAGIRGFRYALEDFHHVGNIFFSTLSMLCSLAETTVADAWYILKQSTLVSSNLLSKDELSAHARSIFDRFQSNTLSQFVATLDSIQMRTSIALSTIKANVDLVSNDHVTNATRRIDFHWLPQEWNNCSCLLIETCTTPIGFFTYLQNFFIQKPIVRFYIPQLLLGCSAIQSVLQSSLVCFFNETCLNDVKNELHSHIPIQTLIVKRNGTKYPPESPIKIIVYELMVERWNDDICYEDYYAQCRPKICTYRVVSHDDFLYVMSTLIGLFGGLTAALKLIVQWLVRLVRNRLRPQNTNLSISPMTITTIYRWMKNKILNLNMFNTEDTWFDQRRRFEAIVATRIYLVLLITTLFILTLYNLLTIQMQHFTVQNPSLSVYEELQANKLYSSTLECPCQDIAVSYSLFLTIVPHFHPFCSSDFLLNYAEWTQLLYHQKLAFSYPYTGFRLFAAIQFRLLAALCQTANTTITGALNQFTSSTMIYSRAQIRLVIEDQANAAISHFRRSTSQKFARMFDSLRQLMFGNGIVSATLSNWHFLSLNNSASWTALWTEPRQYGDCLCGLTANCTSPAYIDQHFIRGFLVGCDPLEALLKSTLECLYDVKCIFTIQSMFITSNVTMRPLNQSLSDPNATVQSLLETLMIDRWETDINYQQHYQACGPRLCTYSIKTRPPVIFVITTIISLFGGLSVALKLMVPNSVKLILRLFNRQTIQVQPQIRL